MKHSGIRTKDFHSYEDFGQLLAARSSGDPSKKLATKTVPFMSGFYDFSKLYGSLAFESREVTYSFDIMEETKEECQHIRAKMMDWLSSVHDEDIFDDDIPGYHWHGSFSSSSWSEAETGESGTLEVTFLCHPFMICDTWTEIHLATGNHTIMNINQTVKPTAVPDTGTATVKIGEYSQTISAEQELSIPLVSGENTVQVYNNAITLKWREERA